MLVGHRLLPRLQVLPDFCMPAAAVLRERPRDAALLAVLIGTPGPYQKAAVLLLTERGETIALTKIALSAAAEPMLEAEAQWLRTLADCQEISPHVPRVLEQAAAPNAMLTINIGSARAATSHFAAAHEKFLSVLARCLHGFRSLTRAKGRFRGTLASDFRMQAPSS